MIICSQCGSTVEDSEQFCCECGARVPHITATQTQPVATPQRIQTQQHQPAYAGSSASAAPAVDFSGSSASQAGPISGQVASSSVAPKLILGVAGAVFLLVVIVVIAMKAGGESVEKKLDEAITRKNLIGPASDNAHDLYQQLKNGGASDETLRPYAERITPLLTESSLKLIKDFQAVGYDEPNVNVWQEAVKSLNWAAELKPGNNMIASRAAYCDGRVAYLQKQHDRALSSWTKAANLDTSWALPVNGLGMIYLERRNYSNARASFSDAISRDADWAIPYSNMGSSFYQEGNRNAAKGFFHKALEKAPNWARPHLQLGNIAMEEGDYATAVTEFETALNPNLIGLKGDDVRNINNALDRARTRH